MDASLRNKTMIVTGASSGIGAAAARRFAAEGVKLALVARSAERLQVVAREVGSGHLILPLDLAKPADVATMVKATTDRFGRIDILFANAGSYVAGDVADGDPDEWDQVVRVNQWANAYVANEGIIEGPAAKATRYRAWLRASGGFCACNSAGATPNLRISSDRRWRVAPASAPRAAVRRRARAQRPRSPSTPPRIETGRR